MADEISSNLTNKFNIKQLLAINNGIKGLKKADNESLFTLTSALDADNNGEIDSNEAMISKTLKQGEDKINELAKALGYQDEEQGNQINFDISKLTTQELFENIDKNNVVEILMNYSKRDSVKTLIKKLLMTEIQE